MTKMIINITKKLKNNNLLIDSLSKKSVDYSTSNKKAKVLCIGLGSQGTKVAHAVANMGYDVIGVCDLDQLKIKQFQKLHPNIPGAVQLSKLPVPQADIAIISVLADKKLAVIKEVSSYGVKKMLCEKPIVNNINDLVCLNKIINKEDLFINVNHPMLWNPDHKKIKKIISSNDLGYVSNVEIRFKPKGFGNIGSHLLSLIFYLLDTKAKFVKSSNFNERKGFSRSNKSFDFNGMANLILENESQLSISNLGSYEPSIKIYHENGILDMRLKQNTYHLFDKKTSVHNEYPYEYPWGGVNGNYPETFYYLIDSALNELINKSKNKKFEYACAAIETIIGAQISHLSGKEVYFPLKTNVKTPFLFS